MTVSSVTALPVLPLRDIVVFPQMIVPLFVGREKSIKALEAVMAEEKQIILVTQTEAGIEDPDGDGLYTIGTVGSILQRHYDLVPSRAKTHVLFCFAILVG